MTELKPGPELDEAVAEAMGWKRMEKQPIYNWAGNVCGRTHGGWWDDDILVRFLPKYSTDLNAAFVAAENVASGSVTLTFMSNERSSPDAPQYCCDIPTDSGGGVCAWNNDKALAICAAILKLKEKK